MLTNQSTNPKPAGQAVSAWLHLLSYLFFLPAIVIGTLILLLGPSQFLDGPVGHDFGAALLLILPFDFALVPAVYYLFIVGAVYAIVLIAYLSNRTVDASQRLPAYVALVAVAAVLYESYVFVAKP